jgi:hypothetical protein
MNSAFSRAFLGQRRAANMDLDRGEPGSRAAVS